MTAMIIPADQWPDDAHLHAWDVVTGHGYWIVPDTEEGYWTIRESYIPMPAGWDWRVPVMRPSAEEVRAQVIDLELVREAVEVAITHAGPNDGSLAGWQHLLALIDGQAHYGHGAGDVAGGPRDSDCSCRGTPQQEACANHGCGFCRATHAAQPTEGEGE